MDFKKQQKTIALSDTTLKQQKRDCVTRGQKTCAVIYAHCKILKHAQIGQPKKLVKFQKQFIQDFCDNPHGTSRAYLSVARKNIKSALIAAVALAHVVGPEAKQNSQTISDASSRDQASLVFKLAKKWSGCRLSYQRMCEYYPVRKC